MKKELKTNKQDTSSTPGSDQVARDVVKRANALGISIARLCREAKVSRGWFECLKRRTPKAVEAYIKMEQRLTELEQVSGQTTKSRL